MKMVKTIGFVLAAVAAGFGSGLVDPSRGGVRGAILGGVLAGGILMWEVYRERKGHPPVVPTLLFAVAVSFVVTLLCQAWEALLVFYFDDAHTWGWWWLWLDSKRIFLICLSIALGVFLWYRNFSLRQNGLLGCLFFWGIPLLGGIANACLRRQSTDFFSSGAFSNWWWWGLLPFLVLWGVVVFVFAIFNRARVPPKGEVDENK